jgi:hypothetical protein
MPEKTILIISNDSELVNSVNEVAGRVGAEVYHSETAIDLIGMPASIQIVDRTCTEDEDWDAYLDYLNTLQEPLGVDAYIDCPELADAPKEDRTPLIIVDNLPPIVAKSSYPDPGKPADSLFFISYSDPSDIKTRIEKLFIN